MIGGTDLICPVRGDIPIPDVIFRVVRRYWPGYVFQNADDESGPFTPHAGPWLPRPSGREFFIYRDEQAARSWDEHGATPENRGTMLYVILPSEQSLIASPTSVTLVCGELTGVMGDLVREIQSMFQDSIEGLSSWFVPFPLEAA